MDAQGQSQEASHRPALSLVELLAYVATLGVSVANAHPWIAFERHPEGGTLLLNGVGIPIFHVIYVTVCLVSCRLLGGSSQANFPAALWAVTTATPALWFNLQYSGTPAFAAFLVLPTLATNRRANIPMGRAIFIALVSWYGAAAASFIFCGAILRCNK